jgi:hypothetical protein
VTETSTEQQPWHVLAPWPEASARRGIETHFTAMAWAHMLSWRAGLSAAAGLPDEEINAACAMADSHHGDAMGAALIAARLIQGHPLSDAVDILADGEATEEALFEWLTEAGIDPRQIAPAS